MAGDRRLVIHLEDVYPPLDVQHRCSTRSAEMVLDQLTGPRFRRSLPRGLLDGLALSAGDADWDLGDGAPVVGSASALIAALAGRPVAPEELTGAGADLLRRRPAATGGSAEKADR